MARLKISISLEQFKILKFFNLWALRVENDRKTTRNRLPLRGLDESGGWAVAEKQCHQLPERPDGRFRKGVGRMGLATIRRQTDPKKQLTCAKL